MKIHVAHENVKSYYVNKHDADLRSDIRHWLYTICRAKTINSVILIDQCTQKI